MAKRVGLLGAFLRVGDRIGRLDVDAFRRLVDDEVYFAGLLHLTSVYHWIGCHHADIDRISPADKLKIYCVLHQVRHFGLAEPQLGIANAGVYCVVFGRAGKVAVSLDVESLCPSDKECAFEESKVLGYCNVVRLESGCRCDRIGKFGWVGEPADVAHDGVCQRGQEGVVAEGVALGYITQVNAVDQAGEVL